MYEPTNFGSLKENKNELEFKFIKTFFYFFNP